ncbi:MAG: hypothetical protein MUE40_15130 [Anaerolineae bacterium]|jgi:hypothetical protein|nr:hypothetical protein [Anaerolineae bacterium]
MAEIVLHITRPGTLALLPDTVLRYDDTRDVMAHTGEALVYRARADHDHDDSAGYHVQLPLTADAEVRLLREFHMLQQLASRARGLPQVALAQQTGSINTLLVMPVYETLLAEVVQAHLTGGQYLLAERTAVQAALDYTRIVDSLRTLEPPRSCLSHRTASFFMHEGQVIVPGWNMLVEPTLESLAGELSLFGQIWHALFLGRYGLAPLYPFNDECWHHPDLPEGVPSVGLRVLLAAAVQSPPEQRFVDDRGQPAAARLRQALSAWQERLLQTPDELAALDSWALFGFAETLPVSLPRPQLNAIWQDLLWRVNRAAGLYSDTLYTARSLAIAATRVPITEETPYVRREQLFRATGEYPVVVEQITAPERLTQFKSCVTAGDYAAAQWLYFHILQAAAGEVERDWLRRELEPYTRYMQFMLRYDDVPLLLTTPPPLVLTAAEPILNDTRLDDKSGLHRVIVQCATLALVRLEQAVHTRTWQALQDAAGAYRAFASGSRERAVIDRVRPLYADALRLDGLDALLERYARMQQTLVRLFQLAHFDPLRRTTATTQTAAMSRATALETLSLLHTAQEMGLDMSDMIDHDDTLRRRWQTLIEEALQALKQVDTVRTDIDALRAGIDRVDALAGDVSLLKAQVQGRDAAPGLWQQVLELEKRLSEVQFAPGDSRAKLTADLAEVRRQLGGVEKDQRDSAAALARYTTEKVPRVERLLDDVKARFEAFEAEARRAITHEASLLQGYLEWLAKQPDPPTVAAVLEAVDALVYALRRCPVQGYTPALHEAWLQAFRRLQNQFADLTYFREGRFRLRGRRRRQVEAERRALLEKLAVCEAEAATRAEAHRTVKAPEPRP